MLKENFAPDQSDDSQVSKAEDLGNRFRGLVNDGITHGQSSAHWLKQFKLKYTPPAQANDLTIGYEETQNTAK